MSDMTVANTILQQLGGRRFLMMTGATNLVASNNSLMMKVGRNDKGVTHVRITLMPSDTYKVEALKVRKFNVTPVADVDQVYFDSLQSVFTSLTGLYTRL